MEARKPRAADLVMQDIRGRLDEVLNEFVIIGMRKLEDHEPRRSGEIDERAYWFMSGSPVMGGALLNWALRSLIAKMHNKGTLTYMEDGQLKELPMSDVLKKLTEDL